MLRLQTCVCILIAAISANAVGEDQTIKVGILHSLSGTMSISETTLKDTMLMLIEEQNRKGGLLGKKLEAVIVDPASDWVLFAKEARALLETEKVAVVFGCWTSVSRKSVLPVFEELNGLLFYPVQYEGEESSKNVFYTGATPNQQAIPAVAYLMQDLEVQRWVLVGTDYVYPRTTNKILEAYLQAKGVNASDIMVHYTPFGHSDWQSIVAATHRGLKRLVAEDRFREDLYYRLNVVPIELPSLRERPQDIVPLAHFFVSRFVLKHGVPIERISEESLRRLQAYRWPGNVRELENIIERAVILSNGPTLELSSEMLPAGPESQQAHGERNFSRPEPTSFTGTLEEMQHEYILRVLERTCWVIEGEHGAAAQLGLKPSTLRNRMLKLGIHKLSPTMARSLQIDI